MDNSSLKAFRYEKVRTITGSISSSKSNLAIKASSSPLSARSNSNLKKIPKPKKNADFVWSKTEVLFWLQINKFSSFSSYFAQNEIHGLKFYQLSLSNINNIRKTANIEATDIEVNALYDLISSILKSNRGKILEMIYSDNLKAQNSTLSQESFISSTISQSFNNTDSSIFSRASSKTNTNNIKSNFTPAIQKTSKEYISSHIAKKSVLDTAENLSNNSSEYSLSKNAPEYYKNQQSSDFFPGIKFLENSNSKIFDNSFGSIKNSSFLALSSDSTDKKTSPLLKNSYMLNQNDNTPSTQSLNLFSNSQNSFPNLDPNSKFFTKKTNHTTPNSYSQINIKDTALDSKNVENQPSSFNIQNLPQPNNKSSDHSLSKKKSESSFKFSQLKVFDASPITESHLKDNYPLKSNNSGNSPHFFDQNTNRFDQPGTLYQNNNLISSKNVPRYFLHKPKTNLDLKIPSEPLSCISDHFNDSNLSSSYIKSSNGSKSSIISSNPFDNQKSNLDKKIFDSELVLRNTSIQNMDTEIDIDKQILLESNSTDHKSYPFIQNDSSLFDSIDMDDEMINRLELNMSLVYPSPISAATNQKPQLVSNSATDVINSLTNKQYKNTTLNKNEDILYTSMAHSDNNAYARYQDLTQDPNTLTADALATKSAPIEGSSIKNNFLSSSHLAFFDDLKKKHMDSNFLPNPFLVYNDKQHKSGSSSKNTFAPHLKHEKQNVIQSQLTSLNQAQNLDSNRDQRTSLYEIENLNQNMALNYNVIPKQKNLKNLNLSQSDSESNNENIAQASNFYLDNENYAVNKILNADFLSCVYKTIYLKIDELMENFIKINIDDCSSGNDVLNKIFDNFFYNNQTDDMVFSIYLLKSAGNSPELINGTSEIWDACLLASEYNPVQMLIKINSYKSDYNSISSVSANIDKPFSSLLFQNEIESSRSYLYNDNDSGSLGENSVEHAQNRFSFKVEIPRNKSSTSIKSRESRFSLEQGCEIYTSSDASSDTSSLPTTSRSNSTSNSFDYSYYLNYINNIGASPEQDFNDKYLLKPANFNTNYNSQDEILPNKSIRRSKSDFKIGQSLFANNFTNNLDSGEIRHIASFDNSLNINLNDYESTDNNQKELSLPAGARPKKSVNDDTSQLYLANISPVTETNKFENLRSKSTLGNSLEFYSNNSTNEITNKINQPRDEIISYKKNSLGNLDNNTAKDKLQKISFYEFFTPNNTKVNEKFKMNNTPAFKRNAMVYSSDVNKSDDQNKYFIDSSFNFNQLEKKQTRIVSHNTLNKVPLKHALDRPNARFIAADLDSFFPDHDFDQPVLETIKVPIEISSIYSLDDIINSDLSNFDIKPTNIDNNNPSTLSAKKFINTAFRKSLSFAFQQYRLPISLDYNEKNSPEYEDNTQDIKITFQNNAVLFNESNESQYIGVSPKPITYKNKKKSLLNITSQKITIPKSDFTMLQGPDYYATSSSNNSIISSEKYLTNLFSNLQFNTKYNEVENNDYSNNLKNNPQTQAKSEKSQNASRLSQVGMSVSRSRSLRQVIQETQLRRQISDTASKTQVQGPEPEYHSAHNELESYLKSNNINPDGSYEINAAQSSGSYQNEDLSRAGDQLQGYCDSDFNLTISSNKTHNISETNEYSDFVNQKQIKPTNSTKLWGLIPQELPPTKKDNRQFALNEQPHNTQSHITQQVPDYRTMISDVVRSTKNPEIAFKDMIYKLNNNKNDTHKLSEKLQVDLGIYRNSKIKKPQTTDSKNAVITHEYIFKRAISLMRKPVQQVRDELALNLFENVGLPEAPTKIQWLKGRLIGKGSFGHVYLALNVSTCEVIAVKQIKIPHFKKIERGLEIKRKKFIESLHSEISMLKDLDHVNIVQYLGFEIKDQLINIFLEYVSGGTIGSLIVQHGPLAEPVINSFLNQILLCLEYLHSRNIIHRDIKSANILVEENGICKLSDFGISKKSNLKAAYESKSRMSVQGSIFWMAPEIVKGENYSAKVDIWSLGCVFLEMWTGRRPWYGFDTVQVMFKLGESKNPPLSNDLLSDGLDFVKQALCVYPKKRSTAKELLKLKIAQPLENYSYNDYYESTFSG
ncbi:hypothetical protein BB561_003592 [Smittium simulii]|uniref:Protein kinase domain-containing protein n=1 Tax=Smittium simulii TaxID=133385 RepID=A0A2T9YKG7_9FUNG|nr:hypothetical protein BB561_003592 [Smittium simulii]